MTTFDDPNREAVGVPPIWTGANLPGDTPPEEESTPEGFDPSEHTVDEVNAYLEDHPDEADDVLAAERAGKARVGVLGE